MGPEFWHVNFGRPKHSISSWPVCHRKCRICRVAMECETQKHRSNIPWATKTCLALEVLGNSPVSAHRQLMTSRTHWLNFALYIIAGKAGREREGGRKEDKDSEGEGLSNWLGQQSGEPEFNFSTSMGRSTSKCFKTDRHCSTEKDPKQVVF